MDLYTKLSSNMDAMANSFDSRINHIESELKKYASGQLSPHKDLESISKDFMEFKNFIWKSMAMMRTQLELTFQGLDRLETSSRRKVLLFHGIPESSETTIENTITEILVNKLKMSNISPDQFSACHRLGTNISKTRPVLVRFVNYKERAVAWNSKTGLKNSGITVSEFLTKSRHDVFTTARKHFGIKRCWTSEGKIIITSPDNKRHRIETSAELKKVMADFPSIQITGDTQTTSATTTKPTRTESRSRRK